MTPAEKTCGHTASMTCRRDAGRATDATTLRDAYQRMKAAAESRGETMLTRRMVIHLADDFGMRPMSLVWRLEKLGCLRRGSWAWFRINGGITYEHVVEVRADRMADEAMREAITPPSHDCA